MTELSEPSLGHVAEARGREVFAVASRTLRASVDEHHNRWPELRVGDKGEPGDSIGAIELLKDGLVGIPAESAACGRAVLDAQRLKGISETFLPLDG